MATTTNTKTGAHLNAVCQLWVDPRNGTVSHSKFWNNIACAVATYIILNQGDKITLEFFQWYLGLVGFQALASKFLALKLGVPKDLQTSEKDAKHST